MKMLTRTAGLLGLILAGRAATAAAPKAYLGVATEPIHPAAALHMGLPAGVGLNVTFVDPEGPSKAALEPQDVLRKLDDQLLVSPDQLAVLVQMHKPEEEITLTLFRRGQEKQVKVKLGERSDELERPKDPRPFPRGRSPNVQGMRPPFVPPAPPVTPDQVSERIRELLDQMGLPPRTRDGLPPWAADPDLLNLPPPAPDGSGAPAVESHTSSVISETRDGLTVTVTEQDGRRSLKAVDDKGEVLFDGPVDTKEQLRALPKPVRQRYREMNDRIDVQIEGTEAPVRPKAPAPRPGPQAL